MRSITFIVCLYSAIIITGCHSAKTEKEAPGKYSVTSALLTDTSFNKEYVSQIQSVRNIEIRAQEKGYLETIYVDEGQYVKAGQLLFRIMPKMYEAEYLKAQATVKEAELELLNTKTLADKNIVAKTEQAIKEAKLDEAKADLALAKLHLSFTEIRAPFNGTIDRLRFKPGSLIDEGGLLTTLSDNKAVYAYFNVSEAEYLDFKSHASPGRSTAVSLRMANNDYYPYKGVVETIESEFDNATGNIAFRAKFPNPQSLLKHGETGKVQMNIQQRSALIIPQKATYEVQDKIYVFVVDNKNVVHSREITISSELPNLYVVGSGLSVNDKILLEGVQNVKDDDTIESKYVDPKQVIGSLQLLKQ